MTEHCLSGLAPVYVTESSSSDRSDSNLTRQRNNRQALLVLAAPLFLLSTVSVMAADPSMECGNIQLGFVASAVAPGGTCSLRSEDTHNSWGENSPLVIDVRGLTAQGFLGAAEGGSQLEGFVRLCDTSGTCADSNDPNPKRLSFSLEQHQTDITRPGWTYGTTSAAVWLCSDAACSKAPKAGRVDAQYFFAVVIVDDPTDEFHLAFRTDGFSSRPYGPLWAAQLNGLLNIATDTGQVRFEEAHQLGYDALGINDVNGDVWAYHSSALVSYNRFGAQLRNVPIPLDPHVLAPADIAVDGVAGNLWVAIESSLYLYDLSGAHQQTLALAGPILGLALNRDSSILWVGMKDRLDAYDQTGSLIRTLNVSTISPGTWLHDLAFDRALNELWVANGDRLDRYDSAGLVTYTQAGDFAGSISPDGAGGLWIRALTTLRHISALGVVDVEVEAFGDQLARGVVDLVSDPADASVWVISATRIRNYAVDGQLVHDLSLMSDASTIRKLNRVALYSDVDLPEIQFTAPANGSVHADSTPTFELSYFDLGQGIDQTSLKFNVDAMPASFGCSQSAISAICAPNAALADGNRTITATVADRAGNVSVAAVRTVIIDTTPPIIVVVQPVNGTSTYDSSITIHGRVSESGSLTANGVDVSLNASNEFALSVELAAGTNSFTLVATDRAGNQGQYSLQVIRDVQAPVITIEDPADGLVTNDATLPIVGHMSRPGTLTINGSDVPLDEQNTFSRSVSLSEGLNVFTFVATNSAGNQSTIWLHVTLDTQEPAEPSSALIGVSAPDSGSVTVTGTTGSVEAGATVRVRNKRTGQTVLVVAGTDGSFVAVIAGVVGDELEILQVDGATNQSSSLMRPVTPPDPALVAPPLNPNEIPTMMDSVSFLFSGANPLQIGVQAGAIEPSRVSVVRGAVMDGARNPLAGVRIAIKDHPEWGHTFTRNDGMFDLAVNGGGLLTLNYSMAGYLPVQRYVEPGSRQYASPDAVVMTALDPVVTNVVMGAASPVFATGSAVTDTDGPRQAAVLFPSGTQATMTLANGTTVALSEASVRATEYTVGPNGMEAMPGPLPGTSGYTYAVELSVDQALEAGAQAVHFNQDVPVYLENFLELPVGLDVPAAHYDREKGTWVPIRDGRIIKILSEGAQGAVLAVTTSGQEATAEQLTGLGITAEERVALASRYSPGDVLWRVPVRQFSPKDFNFPFGPGPGVVSPPAINPEFTVLPPAKDTVTCPGCVIEPEAQNLGEDLTLTGIPYGLHYRSYRAPGATVSEAKIAVTGSTIPSTLLEIRVNVEIAGRKFTYMVARTPNLKVPFVWDGKDAYGRSLTGTHRAKIEVEYKYQAFYYKSQEAYWASFGTIELNGASIGQSGPAYFSPSGGGGGGGNIAYVETYSPPAPSPSRFVHISRNFMVDMAAALPIPTAVGGWNLTPHHTFDPRSQTLHRGDGARVSVATPSPVVRIVAGGGTQSGYDILATRSNRNFQNIHAVSPAGELHVVANGDIAKIDAQGILRLVKAGVNPGGYGPSDIDFGTDGKLYLSYNLNQCFIKRLEANGTLTTIAGTGACTHTGDGGLAANATVKAKTLDVADDGAIYFVDEASPASLRRIGPDGIVSSVFYNDNLWGGIEAARDGSVYWCDFARGGSYRLKPNGVQDYWFRGNWPNKSGDGGPVANATAAFCGDVVELPDGTLIVNDSGNLRAVTTDGIVNSIGGLGTLTLSQANGGPALEMSNNAVTLGTIASAEDGRIFVHSYDSSIGYFIAEIRPKMSDFTSGFFQIPSEDGRELYEFSPAGRHLRTKDAFTGALVHQFQYDTAGRLIQVLDVDGDATTIERASSGAPLAIVGPDGQGTTLTADSAGYLATIANPAGQDYEMTYEKGLLRTFEDPRDNRSVYDYTPTGLLKEDRNPAGGGWNLNSILSGSTNTTTLTSVGGRVSTFKVEELPNGAVKHTRTAPDGTESIKTVGANFITTDTAADGSLFSDKSSKDPRFGLNAATHTTTITLPSAKQLIAATSRTVTLSDATNPLSLTAWSETTALNGKNFVRQYEPIPRRWTLRSPLNRQTKVVVDTKGRPSSSTFAAFDTTTYAYTSDGRLDVMTTGAGLSARLTDFDYYQSGPSKGLLQSVTDAENRTVSYEYDLAGRVTKQTLPDGRFVGYGYDAAGNLTSLTPPGRDSHDFRYNEVNQEDQYTPPTASDIDLRTTQYAYNLDKDLDLITRPDGQTVDFVYQGPGKKLSSIVVPTGTYSYGYHATKGQLSTLNAPGGQNLAFTYDGMLLTSEVSSGVVGGTVGWGYNSDFRVNSQAINGSAISFGYDNDGLLTAAGSLTLIRDPVHGLINSTSLATNATTSHTYNSFGEPATDVAAYSGSVLYSASYPVRDKLGRIKQKIEAVQGVSKTYDYTYDVAGRLDTVSVDGSLTADYDYDPNGNRTAKNGVTVASYDGQDRLLSYEGATYTYTPNGELATKTVGGQTTTYNYDVLGNLRSVMLPGDISIEYVVDGRNRRVGKKVNGVLVQGFLYGDQLEPVVELDGSGNVVSRFVYGSNEYVPDYMVKAGVIYRIVSDHVGSPRLVVNSNSGVVVQRLDFDEFGNVITDTNPGFQPFGFAGGLFDLDTGLVRFGMRDYDARSGRWTARDPIRFDGNAANLYTYVWSDPINFVDPTGLEGETCPPELTYDPESLWTVVNDPIAPGSYQETLLDWNLADPNKLPVRRRPMDQLLQGLGRTTRSGLRAVTQTMQVIVTPPKPTPVNDPGGRRG